MWAGSTLQWPYLMFGVMLGMLGVSLVSLLTNTVVSIHFHYVKILLFSSARSRDFDGMLDTGLPVSMYTTKTPIDMCHFNVRYST